MGVWMMRDGCMGEGCVEMITFEYEQEDHALRVYVRDQEGYEIYPSLATYWVERLGRAWSQREEHAL